MRSIRTFLAATIATSFLAAVPAQAASTLFTFETSGTGTYYKPIEGLPFPASGPITAVFFAFQIADMNISGGDITKSNGAGGSYGGFGASTTGYSFELQDITQKVPTLTPFSLCFSNPSSTFAYGVVTPTCGSSVSYGGPTDDTNYPFIANFVGKIDRLIITRVASNDTFFRATGAIPEPATWALMLTGFALTGYALRRRRVAFA